MVNELLMHLKKDHCYDKIKKNKSIIVKMPTIHKCTHSNVLRHINNTSQEQGICDICGVQIKVISLSPSDILDKQSNVTNQNDNISKFRITAYKSTILDNFSKLNEKSDIEKTRIENKSGINFVQQLLIADKSVVINNVLKSNQKLTNIKTNLVEFENTKPSCTLNMQQKEYSKESLELPISTNKSIKKSSTKFESVLKKQHLNTRKKNIKSKQSTAADSSITNDFYNLKKKPVSNENSFHDGLNTTLSLQSSSANVSKKRKHSNCSEGSSKPSDSSKIVKQSGSNEMSITVKNKLPNDQSSMICSFCNKLLCSQWSLTRHIRNVHNEDLPYNCKLCGKNQEDKISATNHSNLHKTNTRYPCKQCDKEFYNIKLLILHTKQNHNMYKLYVCENCKKSFLTEILYKSHKCESMKQYNCEECDQTFNHQKSLNFHIKDIHNKLGDLCHLCGDFFKTDQLLGNHLKKIHPAEKLHKCTTCHRNFTKKDTMLLHVQVEHKRKYKTASAFLPTKPNTKQDHKMYKLYVCEKCRKSFPTEILYKSHKCASMKQYNCEECDQTFNNQKSLNLHIKDIHKKLGNLCHLCGDFFKTDKLLGNHLKKKHPVKKLHKCTTCHRNFTKKDTMLLHVQVEHKRKYKTASAFLPTKPNNTLNLDLTTTNTNPPSGKKSFYTHSKKIPVNTPIRLNKVNNSNKTSVVLNDRTIKTQKVSNEMYITMNDKSNNEQKDKNQAYNTEHNRLNEKLEDKNQAHVTVVNYGLNERQKNNINTYVDLNYQLTKTQQITNEVYVAMNDKPNDEQKDKNQAYINLIDRLTEERDGKNQSYLADQLNEGQVEKNHSCASLVDRQIEVQKNSINTHVDLNYLSNDEQKDKNQTCITLIDRLNEKRDGKNQLYLADQLNEGHKNNLNTHVDLNYVLNEKEKNLNDTFITVINELNEEEDKSQTYVTVNDLLNEKQVEKNQSYVTFIDPLNEGQKNNLNTHVDLTNVPNEEQKDKNQAYITLINRLFKGQEKKNHSYVTLIDRLFKGKKNNLNTHVDLNYLSNKEQKDKNQAFVTVIDRLNEEQEDRNQSYVAVYDQLNKGQEKKNQSYVTLIDRPYEGQKDSMKTHVNLNYLPNKEQKDKNQAFVTVIDGLNEELKDKSQSHFAVNDRSNEEQKNNNNTTNVSIWLDTKQKINNNFLKPCPNKYNHSNKNQSFQTHDKIKYSTRTIITTDKCALFDQPNNTQTLQTIKVTTSKLAQPSETQKRITTAITNCELCNKTFNTNASLLHHMSFLHGTLQRTHKCNLCFLTFTNRRLFINHVNIMHGNREWFICFDCDMLFVHNHALLQHQILHINETKGYKCPTCFKTFFKGTDYKLHVDTNHVCFTCDVCLIKFNRFSNLVAHHRVHIKNNKYTCEFCSELTFFNKSELQEHIQIYHGNPSYEWYNA